MRDNIFSDRLKFRPGPLCSVCELPTTAEDDPCPECVSDPMDLSEFGVEILEDCPDPFDPRGWEVLTTLKNFFENPDWQRVVDSVLLWNLPTDGFWVAWHSFRDSMKTLGFQARPNTGLYAQDTTDSKWIVYFDRLQYLDCLDCLDYLEEVENE